MTNKIILIQGDTSPVYRFQRKYTDGTPIATKAKKMWITFKINTNSKECVIQKTLENGITFEDSYYKFQLSSGDTCELIYGTYGFDIAIINENNEKKTLLRNGVLEIIEHYTHKHNEV